MSDTNEYELYESRGFQDYSLGHQKMYTLPIQFLQDKDQRWNVIDVGVGIGFGVRKMLEAGILARYVGVEPHPLSYGYLAQQEWPAHVKIHPSGWLDLPEDQLMLADYMFCIEVIEHVDGTFELRSTVAVHAAQSWFWTDRWQRMEHQAEADIAAGRTASFETVDEFLSDLDS